MILNVWFHTFWINTGPGTRWSLNVLRMSSDFGWFEPRVKALRDLKLQNTSFDKRWPHFWLLNGHFLELLGLFPLKYFVAIELFFPWESCEVYGTHVPYPDKFLSTKNSNISSDGTVLQVASGVNFSSWALRNNLGLTELVRSGASERSVPCCGLHVCRRGLLRCSNN